MSNESFNNDVRKNTNNNLNEGLNNSVDYLQNEIAVYTIAEVAAILKTNTQYVRDLIKSNQLRASKMGRVKITSFELERFLKESQGMDLTDPYNPKEYDTGGYDN